MGLTGLHDNMNSMTMRGGAVVANVSASSLHEWWGEEPSSVSPLQASRILRRKILADDTTSVEG
jgi:hypothetical protein